MKHTQHAQVLLFAASGNKGDAMWTAPANFTEVVSVASMAGDKSRSETSNANSKVELTAPGSRVSDRQLGCQQCLELGFVRQRP